MPIRILIVDDQAIIRSGLRLMLESADGEFELVGEAVDGADAISQVQMHRPDVVLMDLRMPNVDGVAATRRIAQLPEPPRILVLTTYSADDQVFEALTVGASGFLLKDLRAEELFSALQVVHAGGRVFAPEVMRNLVRRAIRHTPVRVHGVNSKVAGLSESERQVLALVGMGMTNEQIAKELHLACASVKTYVSRTLSKLGLENRTQAAVVAYTVGLAGGGGGTDKTSSRP